jgi:anti-sigma regulatory factor (Ser/Thr protein kinase)
VSALERTRRPEDLPQHEAVRFDAAFRPAAEGASAGRDWCDAFALGDGRFALSVGEVVGPGWCAASITDEIRAALRRAAHDPASPAEILERANAFVNGQPFPLTVKATVGIVDPTNASIVYAAAGNPSPVLALPCAHVQPLPTDATPLGAVPVLGASDWSFTIPPRAYFVACTAGLIEGSRAGALPAALSAEVLERNPAPARSLFRRVFGRGAGAREAAAIFVCADGTAERDVRLEFSAVPQAVPVARRTLLHYVERIGLGDDDRYALITAVGEALANAVEHAYPGRPGLVRLAAQRTADALCVTIEDDGCWKPPVRSEERGRGLPLMRSLMDAVDVRTAASRTTIALTLYTSPRA